jgi:hypothetical protein
VKLQDLLAQAGWGRKKIELAWWSHIRFERWGQAELVETAGSDPPGQPRRGRGRQPRHRRELLARHISALAVQPGQEVLPGR